MNQDQETNTKFRGNQMDFNNIKWSMTDFNDFHNFLLTYKESEERIKRSEMIIKTTMPILGIYMNEINEISKLILKSDYHKYLENTNFKYYEETLIYGKVLNRIKDEKLFLKYLNDFVLTIDNWSTVDNIKFNVIYKRNKDLLFETSIKYLNNEKPFIRRTAILILFNFINDEFYEKKIFDLLDELINEEHYYVNMAASWLLCELFIKSKTNTLAYYNNHSTNKFIINKSISKSRDSFRVTKKDKEDILKYKVV